MVIFYVMVEIFKDSIFTGDPTAGKYKAIRILHFMVCFLFFCDESAEIQLNAAYFAKLKSSYLSMRIFDTQ